MRCRLRDGTSLHHAQPVGFLFGKNGTQWCETILFTVLRCGFKPRCAQEIVDSGGTRIAKIEKLIEEEEGAAGDWSRTAVAGLRMSSKADKA